MFGAERRAMRIVIGEDQVLLRREGLARLLEDEGHEIVGSAGDGPDPVRKAKAHRPELVIAGRAHAAVAG